MNSLDMIVFEGITETIIGLASNSNELIRIWFLEGERSLDEYDVFRVNSKDGFSVSSRLSVTDYDEAVSVDLDDIMTVDLQDQLIDAGLFVDE